jgi:hypothetical protein
MTEDSVMKPADHNDGLELQSRRRFLKSVAAAAGGAVVVTGAGTVIAGDDEAGASEQPTTGKRGYTETQHVRDYYARADF